MMKKIALVVAGLALAAFSSTSAMAQSTISGSVDFAKGPGPGSSFSCDMTIVLDGSSPSTSTQVRSVTFSGGIFGQCAAIFFDDVPHAISQSGGSFTVIDLFVRPFFPSGDCRGNLVGTISGEVVTFDAVLPEVEPGTGDCTFLGSLS